VPARADRVATIGLMSTWVIVGANRGIGLEMARLAHQRGERVIAACRTATPELSKLEVVEGVEITSDEGVARLASAVPPVDVLVVMAGVLKRVGLEDLSFDEIRRQLEVNALGPLRVVAALLPKMSKGSKVGLVTSRMGSLEDNTSGSHYAYRMSKAALNMAGRSLAVDLKGRGIAVCLLHPGFVRTEMTAQHGDVDADVAAQRLIDRIDALSLESTGKFFHANGNTLPW
jgi:NAD(P)-dependent dehydrogenase (short-subunit alcohol dehydrogenase family)